MSNRFESPLDTYAILAGTQVNNTGPTQVDGNVGVFPGTTVTGFPPGIINPPGTIHANDSNAELAQNQLSSAYNTLSSLTPTAILPSDFGGPDTVLNPGIYSFVGGVAQLNGSLELVIETDNPEFIFIVTSTLTIDSGSRVLFQEFNSCNVYWVVGGSVTLGPDISMVGNILAKDAITMGNSAFISSGRLLSLNSSITLISDFVNAIACLPSSFFMIPTITNISPTFGLTDGGTRVVITGTNLFNALDITIDGFSRNFSITSDTELVLDTMPSHSPGPVKLVVITRGGTATTIFTYVQSNLGNFAVLAGKKIRNSGKTVINSGHLGIFPNSTIKGFPPGKVTPFPPYRIHQADCDAKNAQNAFDQTYNNFISFPTLATLPSNLGGQTIFPGTYDFTDGVALLDGTLTLDTSFISATSFFVFKIRKLITELDSSVVLSSSRTCNIFWLVEDSVIFGENTQFVGHVLSLGSITTTNKGGVFVGGQILAKGKIILKNSVIDNLVCATPLIEKVKARLNEENGNTIFDIVGAGLAGGPGFGFPATFVRINCIDTNFILVDDNNLTIFSTLPFSSPFTTLIDIFNGLGGVSAVFVNKTCTCSPKKDKSKKEHNNAV